MTSTDVATYTRRATPDAKPTTVKRKLTVTRKVKAAIDAMVWEGLKRGEAATKAELAEHSLYVALTRPHVKAYYLTQLEVLRTSERARNIHTLVDVRDQTSNQMARVTAVKALEQLADDEPTAAARSRAPGVVIIIGQTDVKPLISNGNQPGPAIEHDE